MTTTATRLITFPLRVEMIKDTFGVVTPCLVDADGRMVAMVTRPKTAHADLEAIAQRMTETTP